MDQDLSGKMVGVWFPISMFIAIGFEHSVANMFILPAGLFSGPERFFGVDYGGLSESGFSQENPGFVVSLVFFLNTFFLMIPLHAHLHFREFTHQHWCHCFQLMS